MKSHLTRKATDLLAGLGITYENCEITVKMLKEHYKKHPFVHFTMKQKTHSSIKIIRARSQRQTIFDCVTLKTRYPYWKSLNSERSETRYGLLVASERNHRKWKKRLHIKTWQWDLRDRARTDWHTGKSVGQCDWSCR